MSTSSSENPSQNMDDGEQNRNQHSNRGNGRATLNGDNGRETLNSPIFERVVRARTATLQPLDPNLNADPIITNLTRVSLCILEEEGKAPSSM
eukprot:5921897-Ditylum_brightwellii.AAC.1